jgi:hypothetical protein
MRALLQDLLPIKIIRATAAAIFSNSKKKEEIKSLIVKQ